MADPSRVQALMRGSNVRVILRHKRTIVELQLLDYADESRVPARLGNPQSCTTRAESDSNPPHLLTFKRLPDFPYRGERAGSLLGDD